MYEKFFISEIFSLLTNWVHCVIKRGAQTSTVTTTNNNSRTESFLCQDLLLCVFNVQYHACHCIEMNNHFGNIYWCRGKREKEGIKRQRK